MSAPGTDSLVLSELIPCGNSGLNIGRITINSPRTLNSVNLGIIVAMREVLSAWEMDKRVVCVFIEGSGDRAFCAGGDVKGVRDYIVAAKSKGQDPIGLCQVFFENEYRLDASIHRYAKPVVVWGDGIVMGGGVGIMAGARHRIVTESTIMAMPEITIGLYPDVGASYFLPKMQGKVGLFLGLTAARLNARDALYVGLADHLLSKTAKVDLLKALASINFQGQNADAQITQCLAAFSQPDTAAPSVLESRRGEIDNLVAGSDVETIFDRFSRLTPDPDDNFLKSARHNLLSGSPTSLKITFEQYARGKGMTLGDAFRQELILSIQCCLHPDFAEGVRALLVDKDHAPQWSPSKLKELSSTRIREHFKAPWTVAHPLADL